MISLVVRKSTKKVQTFKTNKFEISANGGMATISPARQSTSLNNGKGGERVQKI